MNENKSAVERHGKRKRSETRAGGHKIVDLNDRRLHKCCYENCGENFQRICDLKDHNLKTHTGERPFACHVQNCDKTFTTISLLKNHMLVHFVEKNQVCIVCDRKFARKSYLKRHVLIHSVKKNHACHMCDFETNYGRNLRAHLKTHDDPENRPYTCKFPGCGKRFCYNFTLKRHTLVHSGEENYACNWCNYTCKAEYYLKRHLKTHDPENRPHTSEYPGCGKRFFLKIAYRTRLRFS